MKRTCFEVVAAYDISEASIKKPIHTLVLDLDWLHAGICLCEKDGEVFLLGEVPSQRKDSLYKEFCKTWDFLWEKDKKTSFADDALKNYLRSEGKLDAEIFAAKGKAMLCSALVESFVPFREKLDAFLEAVSARLEELDIDEDELRILMTGDMASVFLAAFAVRAYFSFDPFMVDARFSGRVFSAKETEALLSEEESRQKRRTLGFDAVLMYESYDGKESVGKTYLLAAKDQSISDLQEPQFFGPVFALGDEMLTLSVRGVCRKITIPRAVSEKEGACLWIGAFVREKNFILALCRADDDKKMAEVLIDVMGEK